MKCYLAAILAGAISLAAVRAAARTPGEAPANIPPQVSSPAKTSAQEYLERYNLLRSRLGTTGLGIETLVGKWEADWPDDPNMLTAKFIYWYQKSQSSEVKPLDRDKYMGAKPLLSLDDSTGRKINYFEVTEFDDDMFGKACDALDKVIRLNPHALDLRISKVNALINYEGESPDMALQSLMAIIDYDATSHPQWTYDGQDVDEDYFGAAVQDVCYDFFRIGSPVSMEAFKTVAERMARYHPRDARFISDMGSWYLTWKHDSKTALKYYQRALKIAPDDYAAIKNCVLIARKDRNTKLERKYLQRLAEVSPDEQERNSAAVRLEALKNAK